jgi:hypothetical protein
MSDDKKMPMQSEMSNAARLPRAIATGTIQMGGRDVPVAVLSDGTRNIDTSGAQEFFGAAKDRHFRRMVARIPGISEDLTLRPSVAFSLPDGGVAFGYEAKFITRVCVAYQIAFLAGKLHPKQIPIAREAMAFVGACADIGLEALIDAATGYQATDRRSNFDRYFAEHKQTWRERWTACARAICRLYGEPYESGTQPTLMRGVCGRIYNIVIGSDVMAELRRRNPFPSKGTNHHQYFSPEMQAFLERELYLIQEMAESSRSKARLWNRIFARYGAAPIQDDFLED